jgi:flagellar L-ring protein precursor FlgH
MTLSALAPGFLAAALAASASAQESLTYASLYADVKARRPGDVLEVIVNESNFGSNNAQTSTNRQTTAEAAGEPTTGALAGLFPGMGGSFDLQNQNNGRAASTRRGTLTSRISVRIIEVLPNGNLVIEGSKTMEINSEYEVVTVSGLVDPRYISASNTVLSSQIANAKIVYKGNGAISQGSRVGILGRILNFIF